MYKFGFVILHYQTVKETIDCIESLLQMIDAQDYEIIVVDNASPNSSGSLLKEKYADCQHIHVVINSDNLGFSKGNNIGFSLAKNVYHCDFITVLNNDILFKTKGFCKLMVDDYEKYGYSVLGPNIDNPDNDDRLSNPYISAELSPMQMKAKMKAFKKDLIIAKYLSYLCLDQLFFATKRFLGDVIKNRKAVILDRNRIAEGRGLHGCYWTFSPIYIQNHEGIPEITYMYNEEWILYNLCQREGLLSLYEPRITIFHLEKVATKATAKGKSHRGLRIRYERQIDSANRVMEYIRSIS